MADGPRKASEILKDIITDPDTDLAPDVRETLHEAAWEYHPGCPCGRCMRHYLRSVDRPPGEAA